MMALPHEPHELFESGGLASDPDGQMDWLLPSDFFPENSTSFITNCQDTQHSGFGLFDQSNFEAASKSYHVGTFPPTNQISISRNDTVNPKLLSHQNWVSSETDSTSSSFGSHASARENNSSTSSAGTYSRNSSLFFQIKQGDAPNKSHPNKRRYCELPMDAPVPLPNQAHVVYTVSIPNEEPEEKAIAIFECWLSTCPYVYPESPEFDNLAALTKLDAVVVKSWFAKRLRVQHMDDSMFETWLCSYPSAYPGDEEFRNLAALTRLNLDTVRQWFAQKLRFKGSYIHHNNSSAAVSNSQISIDPPLHINTPIPKITQQPSILQRAASWVREERAPKCIASHDQSLLVRDDNKPYQCTRKCGKKFRDRDDWRKHEEVNWPQEGWICDLSATATVAGIQICTYCGVPNPKMDHFQTHKKSICNQKAFAARGRLHHRKQHFLQHFDNVHPHVPGDDFVRNSHFLVNSNFPRRCGFCQHRFNHWKDRVEHIGAHFHDDAKSMTEWTDHRETDDESADQGKERRDDDDDDSHEDASDSSDDDSDGASPRPRPKKGNRTKSSQRQSRSETTGLESNNVNQQREMLMFSKSFGRRLTNPSRERKNLKRYLSQDPGFRSNMEAAKRVDEWTSFQLSDNPFIVKPYTRIRILGYGSYSVVDEVQNLATGGIFARKTINCPNEQESTPFLTEIKIMKKLAHPHIVQFIDAYTLDKSVSILMSPVANFDLGCYMSKPQSVEIPMNSVIQWFSCLVSSVEYLHRKLIKHQDIKPSNILIKGRTIFLSDFGISKVIEVGDSPVSTSGDATWKYSSPETARLGLRGRKADIFSLGCVFLEIFSFLIYKGHRDFNHFKEHHFIGNRTYQENLPMVKAWIEDLRGKSDVEENPLLWHLLDSWAPMLEESSKKRPSAADLSVNLPPGKCCLPATDVLNSQSAVNGTQTVSLVGNRPIIQYNPPHSSLLEDQKPTENKLASQDDPVSKNGYQTSRYKMPGRPKTLRLRGNAMTITTTSSRGFALFFIFMTFMSVLLMPSFDPAIFKSQRSKAIIPLQTDQNPLPEFYNAAADLNITSCCSAPVADVLQPEHNTLGEGGKFYRDVRETVTIVLVNHLLRHPGLIWSLSVLEIFFSFRMWANDFTVFFLHVFIIAATTALIFSTFANEVSQVCLH